MHERTGRLAVLKSDAELNADYDAMLAFPNGTGNLDVPYESVEYERDDGSHCSCGTEFPCKADFHFRYGCFEVVGHGKVTNPNRDDRKGCGHFYGLLGCIDTDLHGIVTLEGHNYSNRVYAVKRFRRCHNAHCPTCYRSWASHEADVIVQRLRATKGVFGKEQHIIDSPDVRGFDWSGDLAKKVERMRQDSLAKMKVLGVVGGVQILHGFRYANKAEALAKGVPWGWRWDVHFHYLSYIGDGYRCHGCSNLADDVESSKIIDRVRCLECGGFEGRSRKWYDEHGGGIVKVKGERVSVGATAFYQLNHAATRNDVEDYRIVKWFGVCSYRKLHFVREPTKRVCPICACDLYRIRFTGAVGSEPFGYFDDEVKEFFDDFLDERDMPRYVRVDGRSGSYPYGFVIKG